MNKLTVLYCIPQRHRKHLMPLFTDPQLALSFTCVEVEKNHVLTMVKESNAQMVFLMSSHMQVASQIRIQYPNVKVILISTSSSNSEWLAAKDFQYATLPLTVTDLRVLYKSILQTVTATRIQKALVIHTIEAEINRIRYHAERKGVMVVQATDLDDILYAVSQLHISTIICGIKRIGRLKSIDVMQLCREINSNIRIVFVGDLYTNFELMHTDFTQSTRINGKLFKKSK